jgi:hypothetical protein
MHIRYIMTSSNNLFIDALCESKSAASFFCDKKLSLEILTKHYVDKCIPAAVIHAGEGKWLPAKQIFSNACHPMAGSSCHDVACHYETDAGSTLGYLASFAIAANNDFQRDFADCAKMIGGYIKIVQDGDHC